MKEELIKLGLTTREAEAYLTLLHLQEATVKDISDQTKESRTHLYDTLSSLINRGLVSYVIKNNIKLFHPAPPEKLLDYLKDKESMILSILPELSKISPKAKKPLVEVYEDEGGMKTILNDILRTKKDWYGISSYGGSAQILPAFYIEKFHRERIRNKITLRVLCNSSPEGKKKGKDFLKYGRAEVRYLPKNNQSPSTIYVYGDKTAIVLWLASDKPFAILIKSEIIAESFKSYFKLLWTISKRN